MSKKIAEGIGGLVLDVKTGSGAFMKTRDASRAGRIARRDRPGVRRRTEALITRMSSPLGRTVGNTLEVIEAIETLKGRGPSDVEDLSVALAARMLVVSGSRRTRPGPRRGSARRWRRGPAWRSSGRSWSSRGATRGSLDDYTRLPGRARTARWFGRQGGLRRDSGRRGHWPRGRCPRGGPRPARDPVDHGVGIEIAPRPAPPCRPAMPC
jgi:pyrimidine-nucleoside phosphorylase